MKKRGWLILKFSDCEREIVIFDESEYDENDGYSVSGIITKEGQLCISQKFFQFLENKNLNIGINWINGSGINRWNETYKYTNDFESLFDVFIFLKKVSKFREESIFDVS